MPKLKTKRKAAKRFRITKTGKVLCRATGRRHLLSDKEPGKLRHLRRKLEIKGRLSRNIKSVLPYA
jgi:large subunit ribosomal protein L35